MSKYNTDSWNDGLVTTLEHDDPEIFQLIELEKKRQWSGLELIASENFTSLAVMEANGSALTNKYSEGLPGARYYGGNEYIDQIENLARKRALVAFNLDPEKWGVNVQPYSGSTANFAALTAMIKPHDRLMGLDLPSGGHLTHGYQTAKAKISSSSIYFESMPYQVNLETGYIDYNRLEENAALFRPKLLICGASAYPREWDYSRFRTIADQHGAYLMADIAHISGLVAGGQAANPFDFCDVVTTTTHKTLRGPRAGLIFFRRDKGDNLEGRVNQAVFPSCQGGPHNNTIAAVAVALKQVASPEFKKYAVQIRANSKRLADELIKHGYKLATKGTENHLVLWDLRPLKLTGSKVEKIAELLHISINKNSIAGDKSAVAPGGVRIGTAALTSRSFKEDDFTQVAQFLHLTVQLAIEIQEAAGSKMIKDFIAKSEEPVFAAKIENLKCQIQTFAQQYPMPGLDPSAIKLAH